MECPSCGNEFVPKKNGRGGTKTCSRECANELRKIERKTCPCGEVFKPSASDQIYHSRSCARRLGKPSRRKAQKSCEVCGVDRTGKVGRFCSNTCKSVLDRNIKFDSIRVKDDASGFNSQLVKKFLLHEHGNCCSICGIKTWCDKPAPMVMDHIDGNSENWLLSNLRLVCGNCDMQLPTYKSKNMGNGRHLRRKRYAEGKSY